MKTRYDPEADALYLGFAEAPVVETEEVRPGVMFDFDAEGKIVAIEVLNASDRLSEPLKRVVGEEDRASVPRKRIDATLLRSLTCGSPVQAQDAANLVRAMRDDGRY